MFATETGDADAARVAFATWMEQVFPHLPGVLRYLGVGTAVTVAARLGDADRTPPLAEYLTPFRGELIGSDAWIFAAVDHLLGVCAATVGDLDDAVDLLGAGHEMYERLGLHARTVPSGLDLGRVLLERGGPGDREAGEAHLRRAIESAEQLGMGPSAARAASLL
jgi:hypothetical protein